MIPMMIQISATKNTSPGAVPRAESVLCEYRQRGKDAHPH